MEKAVNAGFVEECVPSLGTMVILTPRYTDTILVRAHAHALRTYVHIIMSFFWPTLDDPAEYYLIQKSHTLKPDNETHRILAGFTRPEI